MEISFLKLEEVNGDIRVSEDEAYFLKMPVTVLRLTAVVGPQGTSGGRMWKDFAIQMKEGKEIQLPQFSSQEKGHFVDIQDVAAMHILAGEHPMAAGEIFNCGPEATTGKEFAALVEEIIPTIKVRFGCPWSTAQGNEIEFDMGKMERLLGYRPSYTSYDSLISILIG